MRQATDPLDNVSIVLVNYKTLDMTRACLELLRRGLGERAVPVYVVDNDSADASLDYLRSLDWIRLIERKSLTRESGSQAHGRALDCALDEIDTDYVLVMHSDTLIHDIQVLSLMLQQCIGRPGIAAVGCLEQLHRGPLRKAWRLVSRFIKHHARRSLRAAGIAARPPKPYQEHHLKSFCALWNAKLMKQHRLHFQLDGRNPGYALQDCLQRMGYSIECLQTSVVFRYLEHLQSGTVSAIGGYSKSHRRVRVYQQFAQRLQ